MDKSRPIYLIHLGACTLTAQTVETHSVEKAFNWFNKSKHYTFRLVTVADNEDAQPLYVIGNQLGRDTFMGEL